MIQLSSPENTEPEEEIEAPQSDDAREGLVAEIEKELGDALIAKEIVFSPTMLIEVHFSSRLFASCSSTSLSA